MTWNDLEERISQAKRDNQKFDQTVRVEVFGGETEHFRNDILIEVELVKDDEGPLGEWVLRPVQKLRLV